MPTYLFKIYNLLTMHCKFNPFKHINSYFSCSRFILNLIIIIIVSLFAHIDTHLYQ